MRHALKPEATGTMKEKRPQPTAVLAERLQRVARKIDRLLASPPLADHLPTEESWRHVQRLEGARDAENQAVARRSLETATGISTAGVRQKPSGEGDCHVPLASPPAKDAAALVRSWIAEDAQAGDETPLPDIPRLALASPPEGRKDCFFMRPQQDRPCAEIHGRKQMYWCSACLFEALNAVPPLQTPPEGSAP